LRRAPFISLNRPGILSHLRNHKKVIASVLFSYRFPAHRVHANPNQPSVTLIQSSMTLIRTVLFPSSINHLECAAVGLNAYWLSAHFSHFYFTLTPTRSSRVLQSLTAIFSWNIRTSCPGCSPGYTYPCCVPPIHPRGSSPHLSPLQFSMDVFSM